MNITMNIIAIAFALPVLLLMFFKGKAVESSTQLQKNFTFVIFKLFPFISIVIWCNILLNNCSK